MSNTISEGEIVIKDELPEVEPIKILEIPAKIETIDEDKARENQTVYTCDCLQTFKKEWEFKRHLHGYNRARDYTCKICGKTFKNSGGLNQHSYTHKTTRDFQCKQCEKCFKTRNSLWLHKAVHSTEKPYKCSICQKAFNQKSNMRTHERNHFKPKERRGGKSTEDSNDS